MPKSIRGSGPCLNKQKDQELMDYHVLTAQVGYGKTRRQVKCIAVKRKDN